MSEDDDDKQFEPSQRKLDEARRKGDIPRSTDITTAASYGGFILAGMAMGPVAFVGLGSSLSVLLDQADSLARTTFAGDAGSLAGGIMGKVAPAVSPWFALPAVLALLSIIAQQGLVFASDKVAPKLSRISPISGLKNKFGRAGLFEFVKSFGKLIVFSIVLGFFLTFKLPSLIETLSMSPGQIATRMTELAIGLLTIVLGIAMVLGVVDLIWQHAEHNRKNRMTRQEMIDEHKESEGDPQLKQQRRQKGIEIAMNQMLAEVPKADVIIVNPTHFAVALKWERTKGRAPVCIAKGVDDIAAKIRELAAQHAIPIHSDPPTARALHASVEIGDEIRPEHYRAVAAAIRFAETLRKKVSRR